MRLGWAIVWVAMAWGSSAVAEPAVTLGLGRLFSNDYLGDGHDRWQSGSYVLSILRGPSDVRGNVAFGEIREYRLRSALMASNGRGPAPGDRPYVGALSFGVHSHFRQGATQAVLGFDVTAIGPQTGLSLFQRRAHDLLGMEQVAFTDQQLGNDIVTSITAEAAEIVQLSQNFTLRPFAEVQTGAEDVVRIGADVLVGASYGPTIWVRDVTTGHLYRTATGDPGFAMAFGADVASVADSHFLPDQRVRDRARIRAGLHWQSAGKARLFYGLTYLSPEFGGQSEGQIVGSVQLQIHF